VQEAMPTITKCYQRDEPIVSNGISNRNIPMQRGILTLLAKERVTLSVMEGLERTPQAVASISVWVEVKMKALAEELKL